MRKFEASLLALAGGMSYGVLSGLVKKAYAAGVDTGPLTTLQNIVGASFLWSIVWWMARRARQEKQTVAAHNLTATASADAQDITTTEPASSRREVVQLLLVGSLPGLTGVFYYLALVRISATLGIILLFQFVWLGVLLEALIERRWPGKFRLLALACLIPGTWLAVGAEQLNSTTLSWSGITLALLSAVTYSGFLYCTGRVATNVPPWKRSALIITGSLLINFLAFPPTYLTKEVITAPLLIYGGLMGIFGPVIPTICFAYGVPVIGGGLAALLGAVELPMVVAVAFLFLGEPVVWQQWLGVAIILFGIYLSEQEI